MVMTVARQCYICKSEIAPTDRIVNTHPSESTISHLFHEACLLPMLEKDGECPACRLSAKAKAIVAICTVTIKNNISKRLFGSQIDYILN